VRKIERFREWIHAELSMERERTPSEIWQPL
jgi:LysR family glycine cleavage system transcriptional activator